MEYHFAGSPRLKMSYNPSQDASLPELTWNSLQPSLQDRVQNEFTQVSIPGNTDQVFLQAYTGNFVTHFTGYPPVSANRPFFSVGPATQHDTIKAFMKDESLNWLKLHDPQEYLTLQNLNIITIDNPVPKVITPETPTDPSGGIHTVTNTPTSATSYGTGYIIAKVFFDSMDAPLLGTDIISITTDQGSSSVDEDGNAAKMTVTLSNRNNKYRGKFIPHVTMVASWIIVERNVIKGQSVSVHNAIYPLFFGRVSEVTLSNETCVVSCGDESVQSTSSPNVDLAWYVDETVIDRFKRLKEALGNTMDVEIDLSLGTDENGNTRTLPTVPSYATSASSVGTGFTQTAKAFALDWTVLSDEPHRLLIKDASYIRNNDPESIVNGTINADTITSLDGFVVEPGDYQGIVGYCTHVVVTSDSPYQPTTAATNIPSSTHNYVTAEATDDEGEQKYHRIEAPHYKLPNMATKEQCQIMADGLKEIYRIYIDRFIKIKVCSVIPLLHSLVTWRFYGDPVHSLFDTGTESDTANIVVMGKIMRKCVNYDASNGLVVDLECKRITVQDMAGSSSTTAPDGSPIWKYKNDVIDAHGNHLDLRISVAAEENPNSSTYTHSFQWSNAGSGDWGRADNPNIVDLNGSIFGAEWAQGQYAEMLAGL
jgi:hypothetical protein